MHIILISLFYITLSLVGADDLLSDRMHQLLHPTRKLLPESLKEDPYWHDLKSKPREDITAALFKACALDDNTISYKKKRKYIAALVYMGADIQAVQQRQNQEMGARQLMLEVAQMHDIPLAELLLDHDADVNQATFTGETAIYYAQTVALAKVLLKKNALDNFDLRQKIKLMHKIMEPEYELGLITLYKENGVYLGTDDYSEGSPIMTLVGNPQNYMDKKAELFLNGYSPADKIALLVAPRRNLDIGGEEFCAIEATVFDLIKDAQDSATIREEKIHQLDTLRECLLKVIGDRCFSCPNIVNPLDPKSFIKTECCGHIFCLVCSNDGEKNCPRCPKPSVNYLKGTAIIVGSAVVVGGIIYFSKNVVEEGAKRVAVKAAKKAGMALAKEQGYRVAAVTLGAVAATLPQATLCTSKAEVWKAQADIYESRVADATDPSFINRFFSIFKL